MPGPHDSITRIPATALYHYTMYDQ